MTESRSKYLIKNTAIFTLGNLATKIIGFFLVPLYTNILTTNDYGVVDLVTTISTIAVPFLTLNIMEAIIRFSLDKNADRNCITKNGICVLICGMIVGVFFIPICFLFKQVSEICVFIYFYVICSACCQVFLADLRGKEKLLFYSIGNVINALLIAVFNILFLVLMDLGIFGYFLAYTLANFIVAIYSFIIGKSYKAFAVAIDKTVLFKMLKYSVFLIPNSLMWWIMNSSDHIMVSSMIGVSANGIYVVSYKLPTLISTFTGIFAQAWTYSAIRENGNKDEIEYTNSVFKNLLSITFIIGILIISISELFCRFFVGSSFFEAWKYMPPLSIGFVFMTLGSFIGSSYVVKKDSKGVFYSGISGAVANIILNFVLIPVWGIMGASIATTISYIVVFIYRFIDTQKHIPINIKNKQFVFGVILLFLSFFSAYLKSFFKYAAEGIVIILAFVLYSQILIPMMKELTNKSLRKFRKKK